MGRNKKQIFSGSPRWVMGWMASMTSRDIRERVMGDFAEMYASRLDEKGRVSASVWCWVQLGRSFCPLIRDALYWRSAMLRNYIKIAFRNLQKQRV